MEQVTMKYSLRSLMIVGLVVIMPGCRSDVEKDLGLKYTPPRVPAGLSEHFVPAPDSREANLLRAGESSINVKEMYLDGYRYGWNLAIEHWRRDKRFKFATKEHAVEDVFESTNDAMWLGYCEAKRQIEEKTNKERTSSP